uniref:Uncharacterized protein n=1 Tax=Anguilla anguilla TaxID=7936 RepID=A0A0E9V8V6_ANGAN
MRRIVTLRGTGFGRKVTARFGVTHKIQVYLRWGMAVRYVP